jgi:predicted ATPase
MIEQVISSPRSPLALREALGDVAPEIARIAPALRRLFPDIPQPLELPPELARRYLWNSFHQFVARGAQTQPLLLVLEDLHWADESTLLLTEYLAPLLPEMPVLIVGTYRDEIDTSHPLPRMIGQLARRRLIDRIRLRRLSLGGVRAMVEALAGQPPPDELVRVIDSETEGNPFFVEELYLHLAESGVLLDEHGQLRPDLKVDEASVPESIRLVVGERLSRLSRLRSALRTAVFGSSTNWTCMSDQDRSKFSRSDESRLRSSSCSCRLERPSSSASASWRLSARSTTRSYSGPYCLRSCAVRLCRAI